MPFQPPAWVPSLPFDPPDTLSVDEFVLGDKHGRASWSTARNFYTCALSGLTYRPEQVRRRVELLAAALGQELGWAPNAGSEWDKVIGIYSVNTVDTMTLTWATHRLGGVSTPANAAYSVDEVAFHMSDAGAKCVFTTVLQLPVTLQATRKIGIPDARVFLIDLPPQLTGDKPTPSAHKTINQLIRAAEAASLPPPEPLRWSPGQGAKQAAFLCYSSGTSGLPKGVIITHRNVIANVLQVATSERPWRDAQDDPKTGHKHQENIVGILPLSHIYGLILIGLVAPYRGDGVIVMPRFDMGVMLKAIQGYKINSLYLVPPIIIQMNKNSSLLKQYDLSSVTKVWSAAAPLGREAIYELAKQFPKWMIGQGYGLTESSTVICKTSHKDNFVGSAGELMPGLEIKLVGPEGEEITGYDQAGELLVKSPAVALGYHNNPKATAETFVDGYLRTGDEAMVCKSPAGYEHVFIVDRIKELIKVKGLQVAPAELEALLLTNAGVEDCAVIAVPDDAAGELPKAFVVKKNKGASLEYPDWRLSRELKKLVEKKKARHKWLKGGIEFVDQIPRSPSGKILRRLLRDKEREAQSSSSSGSKSAVSAKL